MCATIACMKQLEYDLIYIYIYIFKTQINIEIVALHIGLNPFIFARMIKKNCDDREKDICIIMIDIHIHNATQIIIFDNFGGWV